MTAPTREVVRITDESSRAEIAEGLRNMATHAHRQQCVIGTEAMPSAWDRAHARLDAMLADYFAAVE